LEYVIIVERHLFSNENRNAFDSTKFCHTYMPDYNIQQGDIYS
jgi:isopentenyl diphosphate isomerase/L-lactate dehydrogenase-like FMN-dependent dehydrogenase